MKEELNILSLAPIYHGHKTLADKTISQNIYIPPGVRGDFAGVDENFPPSLSLLFADAIASPRLKLGPKNVLPEVVVSGVPSGVVTAVEGVVGIWFCRPPLGRLR